MCGIAAFFSLDHPVEPTIRQMTGSLFHRGPDDGGDWTDPERGVALGQRRLSILDLSRESHQPMVSEDGRVALTFNGEIYNFNTLRKELEGLGHRFQSKGDTEVVLRAYLEWGEEAFARFNGMFALAIFDRDRNSLVLARDRMGIKPLYFARIGKGLLAASEVKSLLASGLVRAGLDLQALNEYLSFQNVLSNRTLFEGVEMVPPATCMSLDLDTGRLTRRIFWEITFRPEDGMERVDVDRVLDVFRGAVDRHLVSDVEIGATISGGMDSSAIVALTRERLVALKTFTGYFDTTDVEAADRGISERDDARLIANTFQTHHHERLITPQDLIDTLPQIVWHLEDPKVGMCYTFFTMAQMVGSRVKVCLSGTGGDETFAGYPWRYQLVENLHDPAAFSDAYYAYWCRLVRDDQKAAFFRPDVFKVLDPERPRVEFERILQAVGPATPLNKALHFEMRTFLHGMLLVEDKMGMAFGLETRFPFLDNEMVELSLRIPDHLKYQNGEAKRILKQAFDSLLPKQILHKRKQGFTPPDMTWYRRELRDHIRNMLLSPRSHLLAYIQPAAIEQILDRHDRGSDERLLIWSLLFLEGWCRTFLSGAHPPQMRLF